MSEWACPGGHGPRTVVVTPRPSASGSDRPRSLARPALVTRVLAGVIAVAIEDDPAAPLDPALEDELVALGLGYLAARAR